MRKDPDVQTLSEGIFQDWENLLSILPHFSPLYQVVGCGNFTYLWKFQDFKFSHVCAESAYYAQLLLLKLAAAENNIQGWVGLVVGMVGWIN